MHKISKTGPEYADHRLNQEGAGFFLPQACPLVTQSGFEPIEFGGGETAFELTHMVANITLKIEARRHESNLE